MKNSATRTPNGATIPTEEVLSQLLPRDVDAFVHLVEITMNVEEAEQARRTVGFHLECAKSGIDDGRLYLVHHRDGIVAGVVGIHQYVWGPPQNVWLAWFAVAPHLRGRGLGESLLRAIEEKAHSQGYTSLFVETYSTPEFDRARRFYERHGFTRVGGVEGYLPQGGDMVVYRKDLTHDT